MDTKTSETEERIDSRERKAATESMTVVSLGKGEYKVYSGTRKSYVVNLVRETCDCPDEEYNHPVDGCKHRQRIEMEIGERPIPDLGGRLDVEIMSGRERETEPTVATDGGTVVDDTPQGTEPETPTRRVAITRSARGSMRTLIDPSSRLSAGTSGRRTTSSSGSRG